MYKVAEQKLNDGLSLLPRLLLAVCSAAFGFVMVLVVPPTSKAPLFYAFAGLCFLIAIACLTRARIRKFAGSLIGTVLFTFTLACVGYELLNGPVISRSRSEPSVIMAILCFFAFGVPGARYAWRAKFGLSPSKAVAPEHDATLL